MMETEGVEIEFTEDAVAAVANFAARVNEQTENIGARRLQTIMEKLLEEISFEGPDLEPKHQVIDAAYVEGMLSETVKNQDLSRYILCWHRPDLALIICFPLTCLRAIKRSIRLFCCSQRSCSAVAANDFR